MRYQKNKDGSLTISDVFAPVTIKADNFRGQLMVVQRDNEILFRLSEDFGKTWTDWEEFKLLFPGYIIGMGNDQIQKMGELDLKKTIDDEIFENEAREARKGGV